MPPLRSLISNVFSKNCRIIMLFNFHSSSVTFQRSCLLACLFVFVCLFFFPSILLIIVTLISCVQFKELVAQKFNAQQDQICLIFAGKIMKDHETLKSHNVKNGLTVHLVIKTSSRATEPGGPENNQTRSSTTTSTTANASGMLLLDA